jgi:hypothetical protein
MTETQSRPRWWADVGVALVVVATTIWWLTGTTGTRTASEAAVDYSTVLKREQAVNWEPNHRTLSFAELSSFQYLEPERLAGVPTTSVREVIPEAIRKLSGQRVAVDGFMLPLDFDGGVRTFILNASYDMCQYGAPTIMNQRIDVAMTGDRRTIYTHTPIRVYGVLEVGEAYESGELVSIYRMKADAIYAGG